MALEVAEGAVVANHLEAVAQRLEAAARPVATVLALADELAQQRGALVRGQHPHRASHLVLGHAGGLEQKRRQQVVLRAVHGHEPHRRPRLLLPARSVETEPRRPAVRRPAALLEVLDPAAAALGVVHARDEARHRLLQLGEDHRAVLARLGQRRGEEVHQQLLVRLAGGEDPHVGERRRRQ